MAEETTILHFEVDQAAAEKKLENLEGFLLDNKKAMQDLTKAYKEGNVAQIDYIKESIRLQQNIKKEQADKKSLIRVIEAEKNSINALTETNKQLKKERNNLDLTTEKGIKRLGELNKAIDNNDKQIQKNVSLMEKQRLNIGNYASALDLVIPGTAAFVTQSTNLVGALGATSKAVQLTGFSLQTLNTIPVVAVVTGIIAAFQLFSSVLDTTAKKTASAKQAQEDYNRELKLTEGIFREIDRAIQEEEDERNKAFDESVKKADVLADRVERLAKMTEEEARIEGLSYAQRADLLTKSVELYDKESSARIKAIEDYKASVVLLDEAGNITDSLLTKEETLALDDRLNEIRDSYTKTVGGLKQEISELNFLIEQTRRDANAPVVSLEPIAPTDASGALDDPAIEASQARQEQYISELKTVEFTEAEKRKQAQITADFNKSVDQARVQSAKIIFTALSQLAEEGSAEQKALTLVSIALDTAQAIAGATAASQDIPYPGNLVAMATSIATVLSNIGAAYAAIKGFEEGGYTGDGGKHDVAGVVHKGEYVVPQSVNYAPAAQPYIHALESMRTRGYADGGFVANQSTAPVNQSLIIANALNRLPRPIVDVREVTSAQRRVEVRESQATLS